MRRRRVKTQVFAGYEETDVFVRLLVYYGIFSC